MRYILCVLMVSLLSSCEKIEIRKNDPKDRAEAEKITKNFYDKVAANDTLSIYYGLDQSMVDIEGFKEIIRSNLKKSGALNKIDINKIFTEKTIKENQQEVNYNIEITVFYNNRNNVESIAFSKYDSNPPVMIAYYHKEIIMR